MDAKKFPNTENPLTLRTDFSNDNAWTDICREILSGDPEYDFLPNVEFVDDKSFQNFTEEQVIAASLPNYSQAFIFVIDSVSVSNVEHSILCLGLKYDLGKKFRTIPIHMWAIENNLSICNMDFESFSNDVDPDGVLREFKD